VRAGWRPMTSGPPSSEVVRIDDFGGGDRGAGSVLILAIGAATVVVMTLLLVLYTGLAVRQSLAGAADASALAAADAASGLTAGYPCETADRIARANGAALSSCTIDGLVVTVIASRIILGIVVAATATAGPPGSGMN